MTTPFTPLMYFDEFDDEDDDGFDYLGLFRSVPALTPTPGLTLQDPGRQLIEPRVRRYAVQTKKNVDILLSQKQPVSSVLATIKTAAEADASPSGSTLLVTMTKTASGSDEDNVEATFTRISLETLNILSEEGGGGYSGDGMTTAVDSEGVISVLPAINFTGTTFGVYLTDATSTGTFTKSFTDSTSDITDTTVCVDQMIINAAGLPCTAMSVTAFYTPDPGLGFVNVTTVVYQTAGGMFMQVEAADGVIATTTIAKLNATDAVLTTPNCGTPSAITLTNGTGLPLVGVNITGGTAADVGLTDKIAEYNAAASANRTIAVERLLGLVHPSLSEGRLTLESGVAVSITDQSAKSTLYYTPFAGNRICLFDGTRWKLYSFTERSLSLTLTADKNYDVFLYDNSGTLTLELSDAWTNDTTRDDALTTQDGVDVKSGATTRKHIGTILASASNQTSDTESFRGVWNRYHQVPRHVKKGDTTNSWSNTSSSWGSANGNAANSVTVVCGKAGPAISLQLGVLAVFGSSGGFIGIGSNSTTAPSGIFCQSNGTTSIPAYLCEPVRLGKSIYYWLEKGSTDGVTATTFFGDNGGLVQSGLTGTVMT